MQKYLLVATGGALGSVVRYWVGTTIASRVESRFPYGTLVINLTACVIIGFALSWLGKQTGVSPMWRLLIPIGFVGGYSTFSAFEWETFALLQAGAFLEATLYVLLSVTLGLFAVWAGAALGR